MEVHAHTHTARKKWTHYFWEFLMLFLAVFCGFLAEFQLEHKIERERKKVYIQSMIEDLQKDTANLTLIIKDFQSLDITIDTVLNLFPKLSSGYNDTLIRNILATNGYPDFIYSDRTMQQLKNSGAMRLIRNKNVTDGIVHYDSNIRDLVDIDITGLVNDFNQFNEFRRELFDYQNLKIDMKLKSISQMENGNKNYLLKSDKASLGKFYNNLSEIQDYYFMVMEKEMALKKEATQLIALLKKEYHLK